MVYEDDDYISVSFNQTKFNQNEINSMKKQQNVKKKMEDLIEERKEKMYSKNI